MAQGFRLLEVACPSCGIKKQLKIPESVFSQKEFGFIKIQVPQGAVCENHSFMVLSDQNAKVLGYEPIDASILKQKDQVAQKEEEKKIQGPSLLHLVRTFGFNCIAGLIHAKLFGYNSYIINSQEDDVDIETLKLNIDGIIPEEYRNSYVLKKMEYDDDVFPSPGYYYSLVEKKQIEDFLFNPFRHVIQEPWNTGIEYEQMMLNHSLRKQENGTQFKVLREFLYRFVKDAELAISIIKEEGKISEKQLIKKMNDKLTFSSVNKNRMKLIKEFISRRIDPILATKIK